MAFPKRGHKPFIVYAPPYSPAASGIVVLHRLAHELRNRGEQTFLNVVIDPWERIQRQNPDWPKIQGIQVPDAIAVYPEITWGNPLGCKTVARFILHIPGYWGGPTEFDKNEILWVYCDFWNKRSGLNLPTERIFTVPALNPEDFPNYGFERKIKYFYRGKGEQPDDPRVHAVTLGEHGDHCNKETQKLLVEKLNNADILYSYDNTSAMTAIALLCGCPVVIIPDPLWPIEDLKLSLYAYGPGIGYGIEEEEKARHTLDVKKTRELFAEEERAFQRQLTYFIETMQN